MIFEEKKYYSKKSPTPFIHPSTFYQRVARNPSWRNSGHVLHQFPEHISCCGHLPCPGASPPIHHPPGHGKHPSYLQELRDPQREEDAEDERVDPLFINEHALGSILQ